MTDPATSADSSSRHPRWASVLGWSSLVGLVGAEIARRVTSGELPPDLSAYVAAADVFSDGGDPYGDALFDSPLYQGYPYLYPPGTLDLIGWLSEVPAAALAGADALARAIVMIVSLRWIRDWAGLDAPLWSLGLLAIFYQPLVADFATGNLAVYMFGALAFCMRAGARARGGWHLVAGVAAGIVLAFKPMWGLAAGLGLLAGRRWRLAASLLAGASVVAGLSVRRAELIDSWLARIEEVRAFYSSFDLLAVAPALLPVAALAWLAALGWLAARRDGDRYVWLWVCVSLFAWPRLATYSYVLVLPVLVHLWRWWGWRRALIAALPAFGPVPWILLGYGEFVYLALLYAWCVGLAGVVLWRTRSPLRSPTKPIHSRAEGSEKISG